jgi:hypothetical protein
MLKPERKQMSERVRLYFSGKNWHKQDFDTIEDACDHLCSIHTQYWGIIPMSDLTPEQHSLMLPPISVRIHESANFKRGQPFFDEICYDLETQSLST